MNSMRNFNDHNLRDQMYTDQFRGMTEAHSRISGAAVGMAIVWAFVMTILAAGAVGLALNVSAWFWIAAVIVGGYAAILWIGVSVAAYAKNQLDDAFNSFN